MAVPNHQGFSFTDVIAEIEPTSNDLFSCLVERVLSRCDPRYYPNYLVSGANYNVANSLLNFRNYGGVHDGVPVPVAIASSHIDYLYFVANWNTSLGAVSYYVDVSRNSSFTSFVSGYENASDYGAGYMIVGAGVIFPSTTYYYRVRAHTAHNGTSISSNVISVTTLTWAPPVGYHDWWLPTLSELGDIHSNTPWQNYGFHTGDIYWTSTEAAGPPPPQAWGMVFGSGEVKYPQTYDLKVRAIRAFLDSVHSYDIGDTGPAGGYIVYKLDDYYKEIAPYDQSQEEYWTAAITLCDNL